MERRKFHRPPLEFPFFFSISFPLVTHINYYTMLFRGHLDADIRPVQCGRRLSLPISHTVGSDGSCCIFFSNFIYGQPYITNTVYNNDVVVCILLIVVGVVDRVGKEEQNRSVHNNKKQQTRQNWSPSINW
ncbi:hypothetical protein Tsp_05368 [Trichinella spiralis]|uniref:hypothetical protein n=1 Tax=Trichinella spiralis TaxID=6334 RepID=UPI0001EFD361|nr:hypothetical protein Tsp_05368 [Trichinella spiralis]